MTATLDAKRIAIQEFAFARLFIEDLGWNRASSRATVSVGGASYALRGIAEKMGRVVYECPVVPAYPVRCAIERELTKQQAGHLIIFSDGQQQIWQHAQRVLGDNHAVRTRYFEHAFARGQHAGALAEIVAKLEIQLSEEDQLTGMDVDLRREALAMERVTKRFYTDFEKQHKVFTEQISGLDDEETRKWYASLMLNRLMFAYFIQKKGFLGGQGDTDYLRHKLDECMAAGEDGAFFRYYRTF